MNPDDIYSTLHSIDTTVKVLSTQFELYSRKVDEHLNDSIPIRDLVRDNTSFRKTATRILWGILGALLTISGKVFILQ